jgi:hypothetical protein
MKDDKEQLTEKEKEERRKMTVEFKESTFFHKYFKPHFEAVIQKCDRISNIDETSASSIVNSYMRGKAKRDAYQGVFNKIESWSKKKNL